VTGRPAGRVLRLWDGTAFPGRIEDGVPTFGFRSAPPGLATRRQLRAAGLCPGGHDLWGQLKWRRGTRWAALYRLDLAAPSPRRTPAQQAALARDGSSAHLPRLRRALHLPAAPRHRPPLHDVRPSR
jgi:hypothetical protein